MTAYVLTEAQMRAYWALERRTQRPDLSPQLVEELAALDEANADAEDAPTEGVARIAGERLTHPGRGWTADHDRGHATELTRAGIAYALAADGVLALGLPLYTAKGMPPTMWPWAAHYWKPSPDAGRNIEKAGALLAAALDAKEAQR